MYSLNQRSDEWAWRLPLALQWIFPVPLLLLIFFAPESPYWLVRHGRRQDALRSLQRLGPESRGNNPEKTLAMIERTVEIEARIRGNPKFIDLVKGVDRRRTIIVCLMFMSQNFSGNLITSQAVFFFEQAGMSANFAFELGLIKSCCAFLTNVGSWYLTAYFRRRTIYLYCTAINVVVLILLGVCATVPQNHSTSLAQAALVFIGTLVFAGGIGPVSWTIIAETSSVRLRPLTTGVGRAAYYVAEIPLIYVNARLINPTGWNLAGKCGYVWGATALVCWVIAYLFLPEMKHRSYRELDILFEREVPARQFKYTVIDVKDNE
ncbi:unnamed protein product [Zymoseptoria tritici ST99CH_1E4]|uniref:Major facilitator superfamily (MFS) profile domain-containing protein n=1 Tax=Zymoseptoria tritici ST99CH_1E4 TaxID=1276532 RepID=A0A2H1FWM6_ZYMTR|nr:unnamed protein product [Zymoseptoria tritici ST99CH_1E4]